MLTDNHNLKKSANQCKVDPAKNGFEVSQNSILYVFCRKMCNSLKLRDHEEQKWSL